MTPLELAQSLSPEQSQALTDAAAGRPLYNDRASNRLVRLGLVTHRAGFRFDPTDLGREALSKVGAAR